MSYRPHRNTRQRTVLLEELRKLRFHPTAAELYEVVRARIPSISLGTVYRNLEFLARSGVVQRLRTSGRGARFDGNPRKHYHVRCIYCERIDDVLELPEGIAPEDLQHIWERFYRSESSRARDGGGAGLGLALVKEMTEAMGGTVSVTSEVGKGSRFTVQLPRP